MKNKSITVFCSSSNDVNTDFKRAAKEVGERIALGSNRLIFGGSGMGLMRIVADAALDGGAEVLGVMPQFMQEVEWNYERLSEQQMMWTRTMAERKEVLIGEADAILVLPGAVGTLEEMSEALSLKRLGRFFAPIVLINTMGFFDPLDQWLRLTISERMMRDEHQDMWYLATSVEDAFNYLQGAPEWPHDAVNFAAR